MTTRAVISIVLTVLFILIPFELSYATTTFDVTIDTTNLKALPGKLVFDFANMDTGADNTVTILNFATDGTPGLPETQGGLTNGDIILGLNPAPQTTISESSGGQLFFYNQLAVVFKSFGTSITFTLHV